MGVSAAALLVHPALDPYCHSQAAIVEAIYAHAAPNAAVVTSFAAMKFLNELYGPRSRVSRWQVEPSDIPSLLAVHGSGQIVLPDRLESEYRRKDAAGNDAFVGDAAPYCRLVPVHDAYHTKSDHLPIDDAPDCGAVKGATP